MGEDAAPTKVGRRSMALWRELRIGHEADLGSRGRRSAGRKGALRGASKAMTERREKEMRRRRGRERSFRKREQVFIISLEVDGAERREF